MYKSYNWKRYSTHFHYTLSMVCVSVVFVFYYNIVVRNILKLLILETVAAQNEKLCLSTILLTLNSCL